MEQYRLLPVQHMGGRKGISTDQAIHLLLGRIHATWKTGEPQVASLLLLDVTGAFDHVSHKQLLHNLQKRRIDSRTVGWIASFLQHRTTTICMGTLQSEPYRIDTGIPQGSPLSLILYLFYNTDLLEAATTHWIQTCGWIDDVYFFTQGSTTEENCWNLEAANRAAEHWSRTHGSKFSPSKYQLIHFTRSRKRFNLHQTMTVDGTEVVPTTTAKYLGITLDQELKWGAHLRQVQKKVTTSLASLSMLAGSTWGTGFMQLRKIYQTVTVPAILYSCSAWYLPEGDTRHRKGMLWALTQIQYRAAKIIAGAFRSTAAPALDIETFLLPVRHLLEKRTSEACLQIYTSDIGRQADIA